MTRRSSKRVGGAEHADPARLDRKVLWTVWLSAAALFAIKLAAHYRFGTSFDTAVLGNVAWRLGQGMDSATSMTGYPHLATHASGIIFVVALVFRTSPSWGIPFIFGLQALSIGLVGVGTWKGMTAMGLPSRTAAFLAIATVLSPGAFLAVRLDAHEPTLGLGFLAMTLAAGVSGQSMKKSAVWPLMAAACRFEMAAATMVAGLVLIARRPSRRIGLLASAAGMVAMALSLGLAASAEASPSISAHFSHLGGSVSEVLSSIRNNPSAALEPLLAPTMLTSLVMWLIPWGLVAPLMGARYLTIGLASSAIAIFGVWPPADHYSHHYWYGFLVAAPFAAASGYRRLPGLANRFTALAGVGLAASWMVLIASFPALGPLGRNDSGELRKLLVTLQDFGPVSMSVPDALAPHLVDREVLFPFPRPFRCAEDSLGPFRWTGELPEVVGVSLADGESVLAHQSVLGSRYQLLHADTRMAVFVLESDGAAGSICQ